MAEISFTAIASADRFRLGNDARVTRDQRREDISTRNNTRFDEVARRQEIIEADVTRKETAIRDRRNDLEADFEVRLELSEQLQTIDTIRADGAFRRLRDDVTAELNDARGSEARVEALIQSEIDEAIALDALEAGPAVAPVTDINGPDSAAAFRDFLAERDDRLVEREADTREREIQQQADLRVAEDNLRTINPDTELPRGSLVDVFG